jgi:hypothetical protein
VKEEKKIMATSKLSILQKAAQQANLEVKEEGKEAVYKAADQIANERGLTSPLRRKSPLDRSLDFSQSLERYTITDKVIVNVNGLETSYRPPEEEATDSDALGLLHQMNVKPLLSPTQVSASAFTDDVAALLKMAGKDPDGQPLKTGGKKGKTISGASRHSSPKRFQSKTGTHGKDRYLQRLTASRQNSLLLGGGKSSASSRGRHSGRVASEPSRVSLMLARAEADEKPYSDRIRNSFRSEMEEMLFRSMHIVQPTSSLRSSRSRPFSATSSRYFSESKDGSGGEDDDLRHSERWKTMRVNSDRLSTPGTHTPTRLDKKFDPTLRYSTYDDAKECTFRPNFHNKKRDAKNSHSRRNDSDDENEGKKEDPKYSFISRQEAEERIRREELNYKIGKKNYDALIYKKQCPKCQAKQSYDEIKEKRKLCPNCRVEYQYLISWQKVSKGFFQKVREYSHKSLDNKDKLVKELDDEFKYVVKKKIDPETQEVFFVKEEIYGKTRTLTKEQEEDFADRLKEYKELHDRRMKELEEEIKKEYYPFQPQIKKLLGSGRKFGGDEDDEEMAEDFRNHFGGDEDDEDNNADAIKAFLNRYEQDLVDRREKMPMRYVPTRKYRPMKKRGDNSKNDESSDEEDEENNSDEENRKENRKFKSFRF